jgi:hypothetical protein
MKVHAYIERLGPGILSPANFIATGNAKIECLELGASSVARLGLAIGTRAVLQAAHLTRAVVTPSTKRVGCRVADIGLRKAGNKAIGCPAASLDRLFHEISGNPLIVARHMGVVLKHGRAVNRIPRHDTNVLEVRRPSEPQHGQRLVDGVTVQSPLECRVVEICVQASAKVAIGDVDSAIVQIALQRQRLG